MQAASEAALAELRAVQERLSASERCVETLRTDLRDMAAQRDNAQADLHQARLQAAQLTLQLADANLALREARASWVQERESLQCSTEVTDETSDNDGGQTVRDKLGMWTGGGGSDNQIWSFPDFLNLILHKMWHAV